MDFLQLQYLKAPLYGETMFVCFHGSKRTGINLPLGDSNEVDMTGYLHEPIVFALSKVIGEVKNNLTPWKSHQIMPANIQLPSLIHVLTKTH